MTKSYLILPLRILAYLTIISGLLALIFEVSYFQDNSLEVFWARYIAIAVAFWVLIFSYSDNAIKYANILIHTLLISIILSFAIMILILPSTVLVNSSIAALTIFTAAVFLSWEIKHQTLAAIYYNLTFAAAIFLNRQDIYFQPNLIESGLLVSLLSTLSIVACSVNNKLRKDLISKSQMVSFSERKYRHIFESSKDGIFQLSYDFKVLFANPSFKKIIGYDNDADIDHLNLLDDLLTDEIERKSLKQIFTSENEVTNFTVKINCKGEEVILNLNLHKYMNEQTKMNYYEGSVQDITQSERIKSELRDAKERAEKANKLKSEFLALMSHEIRTPIHALLALTNLIKEELKDKLSEDFEILESSAKRIIRTIDLILNMSEIQTGTYEMEVKKFDIYNDVIKRLTNEFVAESNTKGLDFIVGKKTEKTTLVADQYSVEQILSNLVSNAIKYTNDGFIRVEIDRNDNNQLEVVVQDSGIGISPDYISQLFESFSQEETGYSRKFEGNGLGLALVKKYCELNDADIIVYSEKGKGSTFKVVFN